MKNKPYPEYKNSGVEWLGDVPKHWGVKKLKHRAQLFGRIGFRGYTTDDLVDEMEGAITLSPSNMSDGELHFEKCTYISWEKYNESPEIQIHPYDVIIVKTGSTFGKVAYVRQVEHPVTLNPQLAVFKQIRCDNRFFYYYISAPYIQDQISLSNTGSTIPTMTQQTIMGYAIPLPPLPEQHSIAAFLDRETGRIDTLIGKKKKLVELLKEKRTALISRAVTKGLNASVKMKPSGVEWLGDVPEHWGTFPLRRVIRTVKTGGTPTGAEDSAFDDDGLNWYSPSDFSESIDLSKSNRALSEEGKNEVRVFPPMTVMLVGIGATIGKVGLSMDESSCNQQINGIVCGDLLSSLFTTYYLKTMRDFIVKCGKYTTLPIINQDETKNLIITLPPLPEQKAIAAFLDRETAKIDALVSKVETVIEKLKEYRTALISAAVTGKIDVREAA